MELLVVLAIAAVVTAFAIPQVQGIIQVLRIAGDIRNIGGAVAQAKMQAAADFTHARARANLVANTFQLEIWNKAANCWQTAGDPGNACTGGGSPVQPLSSGVTFGFGAITAPPPRTQAALAQAAACLNGYGGGPALGTIADTACIEFNSRGIAINAAGVPNGNGAFYVNNRDKVYGLTMAAAGPPLNWAAQNTSGASWYHQ